jgi:hypothetical protein
MNTLKYVAIFCLCISILACKTVKTVESIDIPKDGPMTETEPDSSIEVADNLQETQEEPGNGNEDAVEATLAVIDSIQINTASGHAIVDHSVWTELLQKHVSDQGNVNYKGFKDDKTTFNAYLNLLSEIPPQDAWTKDQTLAYWMNVYNAFTIKLILDNYPTNSIKDIDGPWNHRFIKIGDKWYTLNDVEHRIIRKMDEPRIHFALVCAAVSCPRLYNKAFTAQDLEADLDLLTRGFLSDPTKNELSENSIELSRIFKWYGGDFKTNGKDLIDFLNQYSDVQISSNAKKSYKDYNWSLND